MVTNAFCAKATREHNDANILCMGGRVITEKDAVEFTKIFLTTEFEGGLPTKEELTKLLRLSKKTNKKEAVIFSDDSFFFMPVFQETFDMLRYCLAFL